jgi:1-acyl-sn-glycerol-3-phosphate acyltransferase
MKRKFKITFTSIISGICFLGALIIGGSLVFGKIFWPNTYSIHSFLYIWGGIVIFLLVFIGIIVPFFRRILMFLKISKFNPIDIIASILILTISWFPILIIMLIVKFVFKHSKERPYKFFYYAIATVLLLMGIMVVHRGKRYNGLNVMIANHGSDLDYPLSVLVAGFKAWNVVAGDNLVINKNKFADKIVAWMIGDLIRDYAITVDRKNTDSTLSLVDKMREQIKNKVSVLIFAEGGRATVAEIKDGVLLKNFKSGAFRAVWEEKVPIQPIALIFPAIWHGKKDCRFGIHPTIIEIVYLPTILPNHYDTVVEFKYACWYAINERLQNSRKIKRFIKSLNT